MYQMCFTVFHLIFSILLFEATLLMKMYIYHVYSNICRCFQHNSNRFWTGSNFIILLPPPPFPRHQPQPFPEGPTQVRVNFTRLLCVLKFLKVLQFIHESAKIYLHKIYLTFLSAKNVHSNLLLSSLFGVIFISKKNSSLFCQSRLTKKLIASFRNIIVTS